MKGGTVSSAAIVFKGLSDVPQKLFTHDLTAPQCSPLPCRDFDSWHGGQGLLVISYNVGC